MGGVLGMGGGGGGGQPAPQGWGVASGTGQENLTEEHVKHALIVKQQRWLLLLRHASKCQAGRLLIKSTRQVLNILLLFLLLLLLLLRLRASV